MLVSRSSAGLGFVVDRRLGASTEDEKYEEHWRELSSFIADLFQGACGQSVVLLERALSIKLEVINYIIYYIICVYIYTFIYLFMSCSMVCEAMWTVRAGE